MQEVNTKACQKNKREKKKKISKKQISHEYWFKWKTKTISKTFFLILKTLIFQLSIKVSEKTPTFGSLNIIGFTKHDGKL